MVKYYSLLLIGLLLISCGKQTTRDLLGDTQICLDSVTAANPDYADTCLTKIASVTSTAADSLRCSGAFVKEGFTDATQIINTFSTISGGITSSNISTFLGLILFDGRSSSNLNSTTGADTYYNLAKSSSTMCASGGQKVGTLITTFSFMGNAVIKMGCDAAATCGSSCGSGILSFGAGDAACLGVYLTGNAAVKNQFYSDMGTLVINSYLVSCVGSTVSQSLCDNVSNAVTQGGGVTSPTGVGKKFLSLVTGVTFP